MERLVFSHDSDIQGSSSNDTRVPAGVTATLRVRSWNGNQNWSEDHGTRHSLNGFS
jgi:hypothetical protein